MSDITDLESRLSAAIERIGAGVATLGAAPAEPADRAEDMTAEVESLRRALEGEASASAQLEERLRAVTQKQEELEAELAKAQEQAETAEGEVAELRAKVDQDSEAGDEADARIDELTAKVSELESALEAEKTARITAEADAEGARAALAAAGAGDGGEALSANREAMEQMAQRLRRMRRMSKGVRENNERLRAVAEEKVVDATLINDSLRVEIDSLKAQREAEMAEASVILTGLAPMLAVSETATLEAAGETSEEDA
ncbi:hypothetical protein BXY66_1739 [Shimia isoporae]|uniref:Uncharacterized protein n=1 Tax=Shimia isoporae TaxID=647720 RepID=A0A4R1NSD0_9RHOB|nr:hypothetical protein [Shimia isoporae]TCL09683.1 hypothetical protein BXY66_1739 [Shimia isoporae]